MFLIFYNYKLAYASTYQINSFNIYIYIYYNWLLNYFYFRNITTKQKKKKEKYSYSVCSFNFLLIVENMMIIIINMCFGFNYSI